MGFVDPVLMQDRYWSIQVGDSALPPDIMGLVRDIHLDETLNGRNEGQITFADPTNFLRNTDGSYIESLVDIRSKDNKRYLFENGQPVLIGMGYSPDVLAEVFPMIIVAVKSQYPESDDPSVTLELRDRTFTMQWGRSKKAPAQIKKLSELIIPLAQHYKFGYYIDDVTFAEPVAVQQGKRNDAQIVNAICSDHNRVFKIVNNTIWVIHDSKVLTNKTEDFRYQLCYRCGDNSIRTCGVQEQTRSPSKGGGRRPVHSKHHVAGLDMMNAKRMMAQIDAAAGIGGESDWEAARKVEEANAQPADPGLGSSADPNSNVSVDENGMPEYDGEMTMEQAQYEFELMQSNAGVWNGAAEIPVPPVAKSEPLDKNVKNESDLKSVAGSGTGDTYDCYITLTMFDPLMRLGVAVKLFGLGHRNNGIYYIRGRSVSMTVDEGPTMVLKLKRGTKPAPSAKGAEKAPQPPVNGGDAAAANQEDARDGYVYDQNTGAWISKADNIQVVREGKQNVTPAIVDPNQEESGEEAADKQPPADNKPPGGRTNRS